MEYSFEWNSSYEAALVAMLIATILVSVYWCIACGSSFKQWCQQRYTADQAEAMHVFLLKIGGCILFGGIAPALFLLLAPEYSLSRIGVALWPDMSLSMWLTTYGLMAVAVVASAFTGRRQASFRKLPEIRQRTWSKGLVLQYAASWATYLFGYEILFRGLLLFPVANAFGVWPAIMINVVLYTASHIPKGLDETIATLFFGPLLCWITLSTGSVLPAWLIHSAVAVANSMASLYYNPAFTIVGKKPALSAESHPPIGQPTAAR